jgi:hypothetical protein
MSNSRGKFAEALACIEMLPMEDQASLIEVVQKRIAAARRQEMLQEIAEARVDYRNGKVKRGSTTDLIREIRTR